MRRLKTAVVVGLLCGLALSPLPGALSGAGVARAVEHRVDVNTATAEELEALPGVGPAKARAIIEYRSQTPFVAREDLREVRGIGDKLYEQLKERISIGSAGASTTKSR